MSSLDSMYSASNLSSLSSEESTRTLRPLGSHVPTSSSLNGDPEAVRQGKASVREVGTPTTWVWDVKWLVLTEISLALHKSENSSEKSDILLRDVLVVKHTDITPYCLLLETRDNLRLYFSFKNDEELQDWRGDLSARSTL
ncbi:hypothetical protein DFH09DRAFT_263940 [Mycena vulgaris]|nr:hypothetical protein DFH09DRAFT_263940 [Mycena vulgaris]